jgi:biopolymer transport protein ExbD
MRPTLTLALLFAVASVALGQTSSSDSGALTILISADGICHFQDKSAPCGKLGQFLLSQHVAKTGKMHIVVDRLSEYELIRATLESLQHAGFERKIGFVNDEPPQ